MPSKKYRDTLKKKLDLRREDFEQLQAIQQDLDAYSVLFGQYEKKAEKVFADLEKSAKSDSDIASRLSDNAKKIYDIQSKVDITLANAQAKLNSTPEVDIEAVTASLTKRTKLEGLDRALRAIDGFSIADPILALTQGKNPIAIYAQNVVAGFTEAASGEEIRTEAIKKGRDLFKSSWRKEMGLGEVAASGEAMGMIIDSVNPANAVKAIKYGLKGIKLQDIVEDKVKQLVEILTPKEAVASPQNIQQSRSGSPKDDKYFEEMARDYYDGRSREAWKSGDEKKFYNAQLENYFYDVVAAGKRPEISLEDRMKGMPLSKNIEDRRGQTITEGWDWVKDENNKFVFDKVQNKWVKREFSITPFGKEQKGEYGGLTKSEWEEVSGTKQPSGSTSQRMVPGTELTAWQRFMGFIEAFDGADAVYKAIYEGKNPITTYLTDVTTGLMEVGTGIRRQTEDKATGADLVRGNRSGGIKGKLEWEDVAGAAIDMTLNPLSWGKTAKIITTPLEKGAVLMGDLFTTAFPKVVETLKQGFNWNYDLLKMTGIGGEGLSRKFDVALRTNKLDDRFEIARMGLPETYTKQMADLWVQNIRPMLQGIPSRTGGAVTQADEALRVLGAGKVNPAISNRYAEFEGKLYPEELKNAINKFFDPTDSRGWIAKTVDGYQTAWKVLVTAVDPKWYTRNVSTGLGTLYSRGALSPEVEVALSQIKSGKTLKLGPQGEEVNLEIMQRMGILGSKGSLEIDTAAKALQGWTEDLIRSRQMIGEMIVNGLNREKAVQMTEKAQGKYDKWAKTGTETSLARIIPFLTWIQSQVRFWPAELLENMPKWARLQAASTPISDRESEYTRKQSTLAGLTGWALAPEEQVENWLSPIKQLFSTTGPIVGTLSAIFFDKNLRTGKAVSEDTRGSTYEKLPNSSLVPALLNLQGGTVNGLVKYLYENTLGMGRLTRMMAELSETIEKGNWKDYIVKTLTSLTPVPGQPVVGSINESERKAPTVVYDVIVAMREFSKKAIVAIKDVDLLNRTLAGDTKKIDIENVTTPPIENVTKKGGVTASFERTLQDYTESVQKQISAYQETSRVQVGTNPFLRVMDTKTAEKYIGAAGGIGPLFAPDRATQQKTNQPQLDRVSKFVGELDLATEQARLLNEALFNGTSKALPDFYKQLAVVKGDKAYWDAIREGMGETVALQARQNEYNKQNLFRVYSTKEESPWDRSPAMWRDTKPAPASDQPRDVMAYRKDQLTLEKDLTQRIYEMRVAAATGSQQVYIEFQKDIAYAKALGEMMGGVSQAVSGAMKDAATAKREFNLKKVQDDVANSFYTTLADNAKKYRPESPARIYDTIEAEIRAWMASDKGRLMAQESPQKFNATVSDFWKVAEQKTGEFQLDEMSDITDNMNKMGKKIVARTSAELDFQVMTAKLSPEEKANRITDLIDKTAMDILAAAAKTLEIAKQYGSGKQQRAAQQKLDEVNEEWGKTYNAETDKERKRMLARKKLTVSLDKEYASIEKQLGKYTLFSGTTFDEDLETRKSARDEKLYADLSGREANLQQTGELAPGQSLLYMDYETATENQKKALRNFYAEVELMRKLDLEDEIKTLLTKTQLTAEYSGIAGKSMADLYAMTGKEHREYMVVAKALMIAEATMNGANAVVKAMSSGASMGPWTSIAFGAIVAAATAVQIAKIYAAPMAEGGKVKGGSGVRDDVPIMAMDGEYVIRKEAVNKYGVHFMESLNRKMIDIPERIQASISIPITRPNYAFASGGLVSGGGQKQQQQPVNLQITNVVDPRIMDQYMGTSPGTKSVLNIVAANKYEIRKLLG